MSQNRVAPNGAAFVTPGALSLDGIIADQLAASVNDYAPRGIADADAIFLTARTAVNITGLQGGLRARKLRLFVRSGSAIITLTNEDAASVAANRFSIGGNIALAAGSVTDLFYDVESTRWYSLSAIPFAHFGNLLGFQVLSVAGAGLYTPTAGTTRIFVTAIGAGGGAGGLDGTAATFAAIGGAGAGALASIYIAGGLAANYVINIGAAGAGGAAGNNNGTDGGATTFAAILTAPGGLHSNGAVANAALFFYPAGAGAPVATGGQINMGGQSGTPGGTGSNATDTAVGSGGSTPYGAGGPVRSTVGDGNNATGFGAGGGGGFSVDATNRAGGNGSGGAILIWEYS
jgi:hypothetical protein